MILTKVSTVLNSCQNVRSPQRRACQFYQTLLRRKLNTRTVHSLWHRLSLINHRASPQFLPRSVSCIISQILFLMGLSTWYFYYFFYKGIRYYFKLILGYDEVRVPWDSCSSYVSRLVLYIHNLHHTEKNPSSATLSTRLSPSESKQVSRNFYSLLPSLSFHPLIPFHPSTAILRSPDTTVCFLTIIVWHLNVPTPGKP